MICLKIISFIAVTLILLIYFIFSCFVYIFILNINEDVKTYLEFKLYNYFPTFYNKIYSFICENKTNEIC